METQAELYPTSTYSQMIYVAKNSFIYLCLHYSSQSVQTSAYFTVRKQYHAEQYNCTSSCTRQLRQKYE